MLNQIEHITTIGRQIELEIVTLLKAERLSRTVLAGDLLMTTGFLIRLAVEQVVTEDILKQACQEMMAGSWE